VIETRLNQCCPSKEHRTGCEQRGFAILLSGLLLLAPCAQADAKDRSNNDMARQSLALDLVRYGDRTKDALALIQAARIQQDLGTRVKDGSPLSIASLLQRARSYAPGRTDLALFIDDVAASGSRGAQAGPVLEHFLAPVNELQRLVVRFTGGVKATFALNSDEPQKLEVEVLDSAGKAVCVRSGATSRECSWTPTATSDYQIRIRNVGSTTSEYSVFHN
jgi:hypothetical protein